MFMNSENSKTSETQRPIVNLTDKINLNSSNKCLVLSNVIEIIVNKFKTPPLMWNNKYELSDRSYSVYIIKKIETHD